MDEAVKIKPHHFLDMIKLYGSGMVHFVPDTAYGHDFYRVANRILEDKETRLTPTIGSDAVCRPCIHLGGDGICMDGVEGIVGYSSKHDWNTVIDKRILQRASLVEGEAYTARSFCSRLYQIREEIPAIWREEADERTGLRYRYFCAGAKRYLEL